MRTDPNVSTGEKKGVESTCRLLNHFDVVRVANSSSIETSITSRKNKLLLKKKKNFEPKLWDTNSKLSWMKK